MALQPLLAVLVVASLGLTAYVSSVTREVRNLVSYRSLYAQQQTTSTTPTTTTVPTTTTAPAPTTTTAPVPSGTTSTAPTSTSPTGDQGHLPGQLPGQPGQMPGQLPGGPGGYPGGPGGPMMGGDGQGQYGPGPGGQQGMMGPGGPGGYPGGPMMGGGGQMGPGGYGGQGMMGPGGPGGMMGGPSEEDMKRMEGMQKKQMDQGLKQMQRGIKQMMQPIRMILTKVEALKRKGIPGLESIEAEMNEMKSAIERINAAQTMEEAQEVMETLMAKFGAGGDPFQEYFMKLQALEQLPKVMKQMDAQIKLLTRETDQVERRAKKTKYDLGSEVEDARAEITKLVQARDTVKAAFEAGDFENPDEVMRSFFEQMDEVQQKLDSLRAIIDLTKHLRVAEQQLRQDETIIKQLKRAKKGTTELEALVATGKQILAEVKQLAQTRPIDVEALMEAAERGIETQQQFDEIVMGLRGERESEDFFEFKEEGPKFNLGQFLR